MEKKHGIMMGIIGAILFGVYNMLVFLIFKDYNAVFWLSYVFEILAFVLCVGSFFVSLKNVTLKVAFFGIPLISFSLYFLILETIVSFIFMALRNIVSIPLAVAIQVIIIAAFLIVAIVSIMAKDAAVASNDKINNSAKYIQSFRVDLEGYAERCPDPTAKAAIEKLAETARYADQRTTQLSAPLEQQISALVAQIQNCVNTGNYQAVPQLCQQAEYAYSDRDRKLRLG